MAPIVRASSAAVPRGSIYLERTAPQLSAGTVGPAEPASARLPHKEIVVPNESWHSRWKCVCPAENLGTGLALMVTVSDTAYAIAAIRAMEGDLPAPERLFEDPYAAIFDAAGAHAAEGTRRFLALPFFRDGIRLRTRFIDDTVREGLGAGLEQVVMLGAGFDSRGLRLPEIIERSARVFEVDLADLLAVKVALLAGAGVAIPPWITHVPCDFGAKDFDQVLGDALEEGGFRPGEGTVFLWEGVIGYIDQTTIDRSLGFMATAGGPGTRVVFTYGADTFAPETALVRTRRLGFRACDEYAGDELWRRYLPGEPHANAWVTRIGVAHV